jgi:LysM repeat protein/ABC-type branched-subunit amino acid transport system substrate-binding protein
MFFLFPFRSAESQVAVEKSKDKVIISGQPYYIHIVKKGETAYSISKAYDISVEILTKENPPAVFGIKEGQSLQIPILLSNPALGTEETVPQKTRRDVTKYLYHKLSPGETVYFLSKKYGVSENEIVLSNPGIYINKMPVGSEIAIPRREFMSEKQKFEEQNKKYYYHKVLRGETLISIAEKYGITTRELRRENRGLRFPKVDDFIRIPGVITAVPTDSEKVKIDTLRMAVESPVIVAKRPAGYTPVSDMKGTYNIAYLLPLYFEENSQRTEIDTSQVLKGKKIKKVIKKDEEWIYDGSLPFLELYQGALIAADTLRSLGLDITLHVFDIKRDTVKLSQLLESGVLQNMDLIIGPVYPQNLSIVASYAKNYGIPVVSPVTLRSNSTLNNNPCLFLANPTMDVAQETLAKKVSEYYDHNFVFIHSDSAHTDPEVDSFKNKIFRELNLRLPFEEVKFKEFLFYSRSAFDNDSINRLEHALSDQLNNVVLIASEESPVMSEIISNLNSLARKFNIKLFGYPAMRDLPDLDPKEYFDLGIELYTPYWIDYNKRDVKNFNTSFRHKFLTEPSEISYAWQGYDITFYFLTGLAIHGKSFISNPDIHNPDLLQTIYNFKRSALTEGFENQTLFLIKYLNDMDIKILGNNIENNADSSK